MALATPPRPAGSIRLLVAEDEPHIRRMLVTLLEGVGFQVVTASTGDEARAQLRGPDPFDLLLLNLMLPAPSGLELLSELQTLPHRRGIPAVILTAKGQDADREEAFRRGAADFIPKPFSPMKLLARVDQILAER
jgi:DNA-binding response OmpR family regulator